MRKKDIQEKLEKGKLEAQDQAGINAKKLVELQTELSTLVDTDTRYHEIKGEMLKLEGPNVYPDADRIAHLSPFAQVGFMKEKHHIQGIHPCRKFDGSYGDWRIKEISNSDLFLKLFDIKHLLVEERLQTVNFDDIKWKGKNLTMDKRGEMCICCGGRRGGIFHNQYKNGNH